MEGMESLSIWHVLIILIAFAVVSIGVAGTRTGGALVVKKFYSSPKPREDGVYVEIVGRQSGLLAWFFALLRIDPTIEMRVRYTRVEYLASSLSGFNRVVLPVESVATVFFGVSRPWILALVWLGFFLAGAFVAAEAGSVGGVIGLTLAGAVVSVLIFMFNRERVIGFTDVAGETYKLTLKRSVIEGKEITEQTLDEISRIVLALIDKHKHTKG